MTHTKDSLSTGPLSRQVLPANTATVAAIAQQGVRSVGRHPNLPLTVEEEPTPEAQPWSIVKKAAIAWAMIGGIGMTLGLITDHWKLFPIGLFFFVGPVVMGLAVQKIREDERRRLEEIEAEAAKDDAPR